MAPAVPHTHVGDDKAKGPSWAVMFLRTAGGKLGAGADIPASVWSSLLLRSASCHSCRILAGTGPGNRWWSADGHPGLMKSSKTPPVPTMLLEAGREETMLPGTGRLC